MWYKAFVNPERKNPAERNMELINLDTIHRILAPTLARGSKEWYLTLIPNEPRNAQLYIPFDTEESATKEFNRLMERIAHGRYLTYEES